MISSGIVLLSSSCHKTVGTHIHTHSTCEIDRHRERHCPRRWCVSGVSVLAEEFELDRKSVFQTKLDHPKRKWNDIHRIHYAVNYLIYSPLSLFHPLPLHRHLHISAIRLVLLLSFQFLFSIFYDDCPGTLHCTIGRSAECYVCTHGMASELEWVRSLRWPVPVQHETKRYHWTWPISESRNTGKIHWLLKCLRRISDRLNLHTEISGFSFTPIPIYDDARLSVCARV